MIASWHSADLIAPGNRVICSSPSQTREIPDKNMSFAEEKRQLLRMIPEKTEAQVHSRCGTIKIPPCFLRRFAALQR